VQPLIPTPRPCSPAASFGFSCPSLMVADALSGLFLAVRGVAGWLTGWGRAGLGNVRRLLVLHCMMVPMCPQLWSNQHTCWQRHVEGGGVTFLACAFAASPTLPARCTHQQCCLPQYLSSTYIYC
jgi:hypothetical protein